MLRAGPPLRRDALRAWQYRLADAREEYHALALQEFPGEGAHRVEVQRLDEGVTVAALELEELLELRRASGFRAVMTAQQ